MALRFNTKTRIEEGGSSMGLGFIVIVRTLCLEVMNGVCATFRYRELSSSPLETNKLMVDIYRNKRP